MYWLPFVYSSWMLSSSSSYCSGFRLEVNTRLADIMLPSELTDTLLALLSFSLLWSLSITFELPGLTKLSTSELPYPVWLNTCGMASRSLPKEGRTSWSKMSISLRKRSMLEPWRLPAMLTSFFI